MIAVAVGLLFTYFRNVSGSLCVFILQFSWFWYMRAFKSVSCNNFQQIKTISETKNSQKHENLTACFCQDNSN